MRKNLFIALEGIDGSGKSTQIKLLKTHLENAGHQVYTTFEPTDGAIGKMLRAIFSGVQKADHKTIAALFLADRIEHITHPENGLIQKLQEGYTVLCDRYYFSSYAYHGVHMSLDWVIESNSICANLLRPDLNIYIDISPELSMDRITKGRTSVELYETLDNLKNVRNKYLEAIEKLNIDEKICVINGNNSAEEVSKLIWEKVSTI